MEFLHEPVLLKEVIGGLCVQKNSIFVDGTLGGGGHASYICEHLGEDGLFIGMDKDIEAIRVAKAKLSDCSCKKLYIHSSFEDIEEVLRDYKIAGIDGALLDIGVSSYQLDNPLRGFSYMHDAPLDMRMDASEEKNGLTAKKIVNKYSEDDLAKIIWNYGEERWAKRIASFIVKRRERGEISTTYELVEEIKAAIPKNARRDGPHPAKRTFQSIRIEVNDELGVLKRSIDRYIDALNPNGRLGIITFHSLEDRVVKEGFRSRLNPCTCGADAPICVCGKKADVRLVNKKPIVASAYELEHNHRSRSAKLRVIEKI